MTQHLGNVAISSAQGQMSCNGINTDSPGYVVVLWKPWVTKRSKKRYKRLFHFYSQSCVSFLSWILIPSEKKSKLQYSYSSNILKQFASPIKALFHIPFLFLVPWAACMKSKYSFSTCRTLVWLKKEMGKAILLDPSLWQVGIHIYSSFETHFGFPIHYLYYSEGWLVKQSETEMQMKGTPHLFTIFSTYDFEVNFINDWQVFWASELWNAHSIGHLKWEGAWHDLIIG